MNDKFVSKRSCPIIRQYPGIRSEELKKSTKNTVMIAGLRAEILTRDLPNMKNC
jgi:hypothetical protein